jgi:hypothetical protein
MGLLGPFFIAEKPNSNRNEQTAANGAIRSKP